MGIFEHTDLETVEHQNTNVALNVTKQIKHVSRTSRGESLGSSNRYRKFRGCTIWMTGLSGAGKTSIAFCVENFLVEHGIPAYGLDGDNMRTGLNKNLGFSKLDRTENIRRVAEVAKLFADSGHVTLCSFVSPFEKDRAMARRIHEDGELPFYEIFVDASLQVCETRDVKGLYKKARQGVIKSFTGIDQSYENPSSPDLRLNTETMTLEASTLTLLEFLYNKRIIPKLFEPTHIAQEIFISDNDKLIKIKNEAVELKAIEINELDVQWLQVIAEGWAAPLKGFMNENQYLQTLHFNYLFHNGDSVDQSFPIVLAISKEDKDYCQRDDAIVLRYCGKNLGILRKLEFFFHRKEERCCRQFGTNNPDHPGVEIIHNLGDWLVGGEVDVFEKVKWNDGLDEYRLTPSEIKSKCNEIGADTVFAFELKNPIHNGHILLSQEIKKRLKERGFKKPLLLIYSLGGSTNNDNIPLNILFKQCQAVLEDGIYDEETLSVIFPSPLVYAGPTELQWHAKLRMTAGIDFYIVGCDPGEIFHPLKSSTLNGNLCDVINNIQVLSQTPEFYDLEMIKLHSAAYNTKEKRVEFFNGDENDFDLLSDTKIRNWAKSGENPPDGVMPLKAWKILTDYYKMTADNNNNSQK